MVTTLGAAVERDRPVSGEIDFDATTFVDATGTEQMITVGGDRETFDFADPENYLRVDNDVWSLTPPR
jgi:hypothetical protein